MTTAFSTTAVWLHQQQIFEMVFQQAPDPMLILDALGQVVRVNARAERLFQINEREMRARQLEKLLPCTLSSAGSQPTTIGGLWVMQSGSWSSFVTFPDGCRVPVLVAISAISSGDEPLWMAVLREQSPSTAVPEISAGRVLHDSLTGLPNRDLFMDRLGRAVGRAHRRSDYAFAVLLLDLDRFQVINGSLGHAIGDELLRSVAERIKDCAHTVDTIARLGGDEFVLLLDDLREPSEAVRLADRLLEALSAPFRLGDQDVYTSASIGIALSATGYSHEAEVLRDADTAMYRAKALGKARHEMFDTAMHTRALETLQLEAELRLALLRTQFRVFYQPILNGSDDRFVGFEALVRWEHPERGLVSPADFIPVAEDTGLIVQIGNWVLREACMQLRAWRDQGFAGLRIAVNCSARQFERPGFDAVVAEILAETGVKPDEVELEITEGVIMRHVGSSLATLHGLQARGIRIAVDDFGTGYSSLGYLKTLPISSLKVDRSFMRDATSDARSAAIINAIVVLAHSLELNVVAEGIELVDQLEYLRSIKCDEYQGFLVSRPVSGPDATLLLQSNHAMSLPAS
ncbi:MAG: EAL domain-containing protein [Chloroflexota bacterium]